jgi:hypothetical protein
MIYKFSAVTTCCLCGKQFVETFAVDLDSDSTHDDIFHILNELQDLIPDACPDCVERHKLDLFAAAIMDGSAFLEA